MLLKNQTVEMVVIRGDMASYYRSRGYEVKIKEPFEVSVEDLPHGSNRKVWVECDYCGKTYQMMYKKYNDRVINGTVHKCACRECEHLKIAESNQIKYGMSTNALPSVKNKKKNAYIDKFGVDNPMKSPEIKKKLENTMMEKYGVKYSTQTEEFREKAKETMREKYGVDHPSKSADILEKRKQNNLEKYGVEHTLQIDEVREKIAKSNYENGTCKLSVEQVFLSNLFNGKLNYPVGRYNVDILLDDKTILEFDGSGHNLNVTYGRVSEEEFNEKQSIRTNYLLNRGYKIVRFIHTRHTKLTESKYIDAMEKCKELLKTNDVAIYNFDSDELLSL